ncbi:MAG TPA: cytochrome c peroxidase [Ferruginibacter sp.]|nr:cytochrome c peroxidase [Ferruginibacter sp.]HMP22440.1 cytochrome c peroxidase [Ferruginibacter sp.]
MRKTYCIILLISASFIITAFIGQQHPLPTTLNLDIPKGWPKPAKNIFAANPLTEEGFQLGRKLFYDGRLSRDGTVSCASCHQQFAAFSMYDHDFGHGINDGHTNRNVPPIFNIAWMNELHWDGGINHIEVQPLAPITAPNEMGETIENILKKLKADAAYKRMFTAAFGDAQITSQRMLKALTQFTGSIISANSKYDKVKRGEAVFTASEEAGYRVYTAKCSHCHPEPLFTDNSYRSIGLGFNAALNDMGRMGITGDAADSLKFKVPSLRNVELTAPYMHDARFFTLTQVIQHYREKIDTAMATTDPLLKNRIAINEQERVDLLTFLHCLTDETLLRNKRFAPPAN